jgi:hypothetical protein
MLSTEGAVSTEYLVSLVYELLDAHGDTIELAAGEVEPAWAAHVDYLRGLQRVGREALARAL